MNTSLPLWPKLLMTAWLAMLVPVYWRRYGPSNFLWFSDLALIIITAALWLESRLLASIAALAALVPEIGWNIDFLSGLATGRYPIGIAGYMRGPRLPRWLRGLSLFHIPLVPLLLWLIRRLGYDRRALPVQTSVTLIVLPLSRVLSKPQDNINWVYGFGDRPQTLLPPRLYLALLMLGVPLLILLPTHAALSRWRGITRGRAGS